MLREMPNGSSFLDLTFLAAAGRAIFRIDRTDSSSEKLLIAQELFVVEIPPGRDARIEYFLSLGSFTRRNSARRALCLYFLALLSRYFSS